MAKLTQKENLRLALKGEIPQYLPYSAARFGPENPPIYTMAGMSVTRRNIGPEGGVDEWGVPIIINSTKNLPPMPKTSDFILKDIRKWRDVLKQPDYSDVDWELTAKRDKEALNLNPDETTYTVGASAGLFQTVVALMGFTEGLVAFYEEPEEMHEMLDFLNINGKFTTQKVVDYYKPDGYYLLDDTAAKLTPFLSPEMFSEFLVPRYKECLDIARERELPIFYHNCGRAEDLLPAMVEIGVNLWDPAQVENDLEAVKARFGNKLIICGGYSYFKPSTWPNVNEEEVRETVREAVRKLAPGGGYVFSGGVYSLDSGDEDTKRVNGIIHDEIKKLSDTVYK